MHVVIQFHFEGVGQSDTIQELVSACFTDTLDYAQALLSSEAYKSVAVDRT